MKSLFRFVFFRIMGWKIINGFPDHIDKYIVIAAPHTSNWDFPIGVLTKFIEGKDIRFIGKHTLFKPPFGYFFRAMGGTPIDRSASQNTVQSVIELFNTIEGFKFALSPEGTRKKVSKWKTGFYHVAKGADVPVVMATLDFGKKQVLIDQPYYLTDDIKKDFEYFHQFFKDVKGKNPDQFDPNFHLHVE